MVYSRSVGQLGPFEPSLDAHMPRVRVRAAVGVLWWKGNGVGEEVAAVKDGDDAVGGGAVVNFDMFGVAGNSVERYPGMGIDHCVLEVCRAQKVGCGWREVHECELRVHSEGGGNGEKDEEMGRRMRKWGREES